jgi:hypothetical protein
MADGRTTLLILVMISFFLSLAGYNSMLTQLTTDWLGGSGLGGLTAFLGLLIWGIILVIGTPVLSGVLGSNFGQIYTIPIAIISGVILGLFTVPLSFLTEPAIPVIIRTLVGLIMGTMLISTILSFIRGGEF